MQPIPHMEITKEEKMDQIDLEGQIRKKAEQLNAQHVYRFAALKHHQKKDNDTDKQGPGDLPIQETGHRRKISSCGWHHTKKKHKLPV